MTRRHRRPDSNRVRRWAGRPTSAVPNTHHHDRDQEGALAADQVTDPSEDQGTERANRKARHRRWQGSRGRLRVSLPGGKNSAPKNTASVPYEIEVVPLEDGAEPRKIMRRWARSMPFPAAWGCVLVLSPRRSSGCCERYSTHCEPRGHSPLFFPMTAIQPDLIAHCPTRRIDGELPRRDG